MRELLSPQAVLASLDAPAKKDVLQHIAQHAAALVNQDAHSVFDVLWEREKLGTTGIGAGLAIPHGRLAGIDRVQGFFARLTQPIEFDAVDNRPVDLVFLLLAPESAGADHLHALATISRMLRDPALCAQLRRAKDEAAIYRLLADSPTAQAA